MNEERVARGLGWISLGLGLAELAGARSISRFLGVEDRTALIQMFGCREVVSGLGIFLQQRPTTWVWSRVAGDVMDLAALSSANHEDNTQRTKVVASIAAVAGITAVDTWCAWRLSSRTYLRARSKEGSVSDWTLPAPRPVHSD